MGVFVVCHSTNKELLKKDQRLCPIDKTSNVQPIFERQAAINQSAHADKTHHTFDFRLLKMLSVTEEQITWLDFAVSQVRHTS